MEPSHASDGQEIKSNIDSIIDISEKWLVKLRRRRKQVKLAGAILTTLLVFVGSVAVALGYILSEYSIGFFIQHRVIFLIVLLAAGIIAIFSGVASYMVQGRKQDKSLDELASLISQIKKELQNAQNQGPISADMLPLAEKILALVPEVVRKRNQDSFLFGILAFVITIIPAKLPFAILIGVLVWLYFRYEMNKDYDREIARFQEQKQLFERRKNEFMQTL